MADKAGLRIQRSRVFQIENLSVAGNFKREIIINFCHKPSKRLFLSCKTIQCEHCCITNGKTFIFHLLIIRSVSGVLHICENKCFILWNDSGTMLHLKRRFMKHGFAVWSNPSDYEARLSAYEAKPFQASCFFAQNLGKKNGVQVFVPAPWPSLSAVKIHLVENEFTAQMSFADLLA